MINTDRIIQLLGSGLSAEIVATAVGCEPSYVSQLLSDEEFAKKVSELRVVNLQAATNRDNKWNEIEDKLLDKLSASVEYLIKPRDIIQTLAVVNSAKRRGASAQENITVNNTVVNLTLPRTAVHNFTVNSLNQVIGVNEQSLLTIPSGNVKSLLNKAATMLPQDLAGTEKQDGQEDARHTEAEAARERLKARLGKFKTPVRADDL